VHFEKDTLTTNIFVDNYEYVRINIRFMPRPSPTKPTDGELEILQCLWQGGPMTVRGVYDQLSKRKTMGYTTVLKLMQIMVDKGLLRRDEAERAHVYSPRIARANTRQRLIDDLLERAFEGSAKQLVMQALASHKASAEELDEIRKMIDDYMRGAK
jgi:predicted transcriptional regulator